MEFVQVEVRRVNVGVQAWSCIPRHFDAWSLNGCVFLYFVYYIYILGVLMLCFEVDV